jgi:hypothetical protein
MRTLISGVGVGEEERGSPHVPAGQVLRCQRECVRTISITVVLVLHRIVTAPLTPSRESTEGNAVLPLRLGEEGLS